MDKDRQKQCRMLAGLSKGGTVRIFQLHVGKKTQILVDEGCITFAQHGKKPTLPCWYILTAKGKRWIGDWYVWKRKCKTPLPEYRPYTVSGGLPSLGKRR